jgi:glyoxylase-like metal-dependent hydrolase (beta-lactamase superfamily II)
MASTQEHPEETCVNPVLPEYEIYALRYATMARKRQEAFMAFDPHDGPFPIDYSVWVILNSERTILVDTGFSAEASVRRKRDYLCSPIDAIARLGIKPEDVKDVIITHLHYDHAGNVHKLPNARLHLQEKELQYATGKYMKFDVMRHAYDEDDVVNIVRGVYKQRVEFYEGDAPFAPGIELIYIGGHTAGLQAVRVHTKRGWVVLASDAAHYYANLFKESPFPIIFHVGDMLEGFRTLLARADSVEHVVPGHDPLVRQRYPAWKDGDSEIVLLHEPPLAPLDIASL